MKYFALTGQSKYASLINAQSRMAPVYMAQAVELKKIWGVLSFLKLRTSVIVWYRHISLK